MKLSEESCRGAAVRGSCNDGDQEEDTAQSKPHLEGLSRVAWHGGRRLALVVQYKAEMI